MHSHDEVVDKLPTYQIKAYLLSSSQVMFIQSKTVFKLGE